MGHFPSYWDYGKRPLAFPITDNCIIDAVLQGIGAHTGLTLSVFFFQPGLISIETAKIASSQQNSKALK